MLIQTNINRTLKQNVMVDVVKCFGVIQKAGPHETPGLLSRLVPTMKHLHQSVCATGLRNTTKLPMIYLVPNLSGNQSSTIDSSTFATVGSEIQV